MKTENCKNCKNYVCDLVNLVLCQRKDHQVGIPKKNEKAMS